MMQERSGFDNTEKKKRKVFEWRAENLREKLTDRTKQAETDALTGLLRRNAFEKRMDGLIGRFARGRQGDVGLERVSFLIIDIDHFKSVNDAFGHPQGDKVLQQVAEVLKRHVPRQSDMVGRWGGEEFVIGFENPDGVALNKAEEIRKDVESSVTLPDGKRVTVSVGIAETTGLRSVEQLYKRADEALYEAKEGGRNRTVVAGLLE